MKTLWSLFILLFMVLSASVLFHWIYDNRIEPLRQEKSIKIEVHHRYKETMVIGRDTNITYVDSITFEQK